MRHEDRGNLLEHLVLGELLAYFHLSEVFFWRDKQKHELDFVIKSGRRKSLLVIECKGKARQFDPQALKSFRNNYPAGENIVLSLDSDGITKKLVAGMEVHFCGLNDLHGLLATLV